MKFTSQVERLQRAGGLERDFLEPQPGMAPHRQLKRRTALGVSHSRQVGCSARSTHPPPPQGKRRLSNDDALREFLEVQARFRLPSVSLVEKDLYVVRAIAAVAAIDAAPFALVFGGGRSATRRRSCCGLMATS